MYRAKTYQLGSEYRLIVNSSRPAGTAEIQAQIARPSSISTSQAWQDPIRQPVGMKTPARSATWSIGSPTSASMVTLSGKNRMLTLILTEMVKLDLNLNELLQYRQASLKQLLVVRGS